MKRIIFTVTNDLSYDQRMQRICGSLAAHGFQVLLVGYSRKNSLPLTAKSYRQKRFTCWFTRGKLFYIEYSFRLFFFLLFQKADLICAIDLDSILPCYWVSKFKKTKRVYDAHEYFTQLDEVVTRPAILKFWLMVEKWMVPRFKNGYTVCESIADEFRHKYRSEYTVIRNMPLLSEVPVTEKKSRIVLYQGAVNRGRGLDKLVLAMKKVHAGLMICGDGNYMDEVKRIVSEQQLSGKIKFTGMLLPEDLKRFTAGAYIAINPFENRGLNQYYSLSNKFFDYIHACVPQVTMNFPEYKKINDVFEVAVLIDDLYPDTIASALNNLLENDVLHTILRKNCAQARMELNWQQEEKKLLDFYHKLLHD